MKTTSLLLHGANLFFLFAYGVRDILKLRLMAFAAQALLLAFHAVMKSWDLVAWDILFLAIHVVQIRRLWLERRPIALTDDERTVHRLAFHALLPREIRKLCGAADFGDTKDGEIVVKTGEEPSHLVLILSGEVDVRVNDARVARLGEGRFIGEMTYLAGGCATADAVATAGVRLARFRKADLQRLVETAPDLRAHIQAVLGRDLVEKLRVAHARA